MNKYAIKKLGEATIPSPLIKHKKIKAFEGAIFSDDTEIILKNVTLKNESEMKFEGFEEAGPREKIYFNPSETKAAIITCGGICPGINDVIRGIVLDLHYAYGVEDIIGIRFGYSGLAENPSTPPIKLTPEVVSYIHDLGGTMLGSSRGCPTESEIVDSLQRLGVNILFCIGGDGTLRGAHDIHKEVEKRDAKISVVGVPKTIDNDVGLVYRSFGFQSAVAEAKKALQCAHVEATCAENGVGLVKLMGRDAGYIASSATMASGDVNYCLIPEAKFPLHGENGLIEVLKKRLDKRGHAVIAVAEGAGTDLIGSSDKYDASGNLLHKDIGLFLKDELKKAFDEAGKKISIKYIDPSYTIRSVPANSDDSIFCADLAKAAVHAAMAGKTDMLVGYWHGEFTHVPLDAAENEKKRIQLTQGLWRGVLSMTGQPPEWV
jgi:6-phosphofructokinase 1